MMMNENKKDNYHIMSLIGKGAYGHVYKARKKYTGQFVAIKSIKKKGKQ
jgi:serine/threonine protein kinase